MPPRTKSRHGKISPTRAVARAAQALRQGVPVLLKGRDGIAISALAVETASDHALVKLKAGPKNPALLALTHARARTLKMRLYTPGVVALIAPPRAALLRAIADPTTDLNEPLKGPFETLRGTLPDALTGAVKLAKLAGLLPAVVAVRARGGAAALNAQDVVDYEEQALHALTLVTRARVPLKGAQVAELIAFRTPDAGPEHYAILIGAPSTAKPVLTRLHSECFTGDLLDSLRCDCGAQLRGAIETIEKAGGGILLYLAQEGRGIGLINKLRAYRLQDQGFDTMEANTRLGFEEDERLYGVAARMLQLLGYKSVKLLTNNPHKVAALKEAGIRVAARVPHKFPSNVHNRDYLRSKAKAGHLL